MVHLYAGLISALVSVRLLLFLYKRRKRNLNQNFARVAYVNKKTMNQKILVVGGCGYVGTHMVKALLAANYDVVTLDNLSTGHLNLLPGGEFIKGDIGDTELLDKLFSEHHFEAVMHFAAFIEVGESVRLPLKYYQNNVAATINLLDAMVRNGVLKFIFSSTAAVYGEPLHTPIDENHPCKPTSPYGQTKLTVEKIIEACNYAYSLRYIILRYFNAAGADPSATIGEKHIPESHLIPLVLQVASGKRETISIYGKDYPTPDGTCIRDYIHVNDLTAAHLLALQALQKGTTKSIYNLGNCKGSSVREVIEAARRITGRPIAATESDKRPGDPAVLIASSDKARRELGWKPQYETLDTIIECAWNWHKSHIN